MSRGAQRLDEAFDAAARDVCCGDGERERAGRTREGARATKIAVADGAERGELENRRTVGSLSRRTRGTARHLQLAAEVVREQSAGRIDLICKKTATWDVVERSPVLAFAEDRLLHAAAVVEQHRRSGAHDLVRDEDLVFVLVVAGLEEVELQRPLLADELARADRDDATDETVLPRLRLPVELEEASVVIDALPLSPRPGDEVAQRRKSFEGHRDRVLDCAALQEGLDLCVSRPSDGVVCA